MNKKTKIILPSVAQLMVYGSTIFLIGKLQPLPLTPVPVIHTDTAKPSSEIVALENETTSLNLIQSGHQHANNSAQSIKFEDIKESVKKEIKYHMFTSPNDPGYINDWALTKINAPSAWDTSTGNGQTIVAVIDGGFALAHEDLTSRWQTNTEEMGKTKTSDRCWTGVSVNKDSNKCDDDNNGYIDDWRGWSFIYDDNDPQAGRGKNRGNGVRHASEVAGLVGAETNNNLGISSLAWNTKIMPLQALDDDGGGYTSGVTAAVYYAVNNGANVINLSLGAYENDPSLELAINYAIKKDVVVVAAAGNCGDGSSAECAGIPVGTIAYPAAYPDVIAVGASTQSDQRASFSSYGTAIDVMAPGHNVPMSASWSVSNQTSSYATNLYGTSYASPIVSSLAALIKSIRPSTSVADITALINATATKPASMSGIIYNSQFGHGIINANSALTIASALNTATAIPSLLQAGSYRSEHTTYSNDTISSGCLGIVGSACTIELVSTAGHKRYLPYSTINTSSGIGWSWSSNILDSAFWEIRARQGENTSTTPYLLLKK